MEVEGMYQWTTVYGMHHETDTVACHVVAALTLVPDKVMALWSARHLLRVFLRTDILVGSPFAVCYV